MTKILGENYEPAANADVDDDMTEEVGLIHSATSVAALTNDNSCLDAECWKNSS